MNNNITELLDIHKLYWQGKAATETFIILIPIFLLILVIFGYLIKSKKRKPPLSVLIFTFSSIYFVSITKAMCPVCTVAIGAGLSYSRAVGIDDFITSIWMGGLVISTINWILSWLEKRKIKSLKVTLITYTVMYLLVIVPLWYMGTIGGYMNTLFGIDKVLLGIIVGSIFFVIGMLLNNYLKSTNSGNAYFPFQKVVCPIGFLWLATVISYYITYYLV